MSMAPSALADTLLLWFEAHGRRNLPWQSNPTPYRVWVSEVMLQQTQVETVKPYFERFIARFPDAGLPCQRAAGRGDAPLVGSWLLRAGAQPAARRAGNCRATRRSPARDPGRTHRTAWNRTFNCGRDPRARAWPASPDPRRQRQARACARLSGRGSARSVAGAKKLWALALDCTPPARVAEYTQAIMDLGATVCTRTNPACTSCPLAIGCGALAAGRVGEIPVARRRAPRRLRQTHMVFALSEGRVMLERRPPRGIWGGLWAPPEFPDAGAAEAFAATRFGPAIASTRRLPPVRHVFTHFDLDIEPWLLELQGHRWRGGGGGIALARTGVD